MNTKENLKNNKTNASSETQSEKKVKRIKQSLTWHFMSWFLEFVHNTGACFDKQFLKLFTPVEEYVNSKIEIPHIYELKDEYVISEYIAVDEKDYTPE